MLSIRYQSVLAFLLLTTAAMSSPAQDVDKAAMSRLVSDFRRARQDAERRIQIALELADMSTEAVGGLHKPIEAELRAIEGRLRRSELDPRATEQIENLRSVLKDLRGDPGLTEEKIREHGEPAVEQLKILVALWNRQRQQLFADFKRVSPAVSHIRKLCVKLIDEWEGTDEPLPVTEYLARIDQLEELATPTPLEQKATEVAAHNAKFSTNIPRQVSQGVLSTNQLRFLCGLAPLRIDAELSRAAWGHSDDMRRLDFFSHVSPVEGKKTFADRAKQAGTTASGENIYAGSTSGNAAVEAWFFSPGHHKLMLGNHERVGLGNSGKHWTMLLGR